MATKQTEVNVFIEALTLIPKIGNEYASLTLDGKRLMTNESTQLLGNTSATFTISLRDQSWVFDNWYPARSIINFSPKTLGYTGESAVLDRKHAKNWYNFYTNPRESGELSDVLKMVKMEVIAVLGYLSACVIKGGGDSHENRMKGKILYDWMQLLPLPWKEITVTVNGVTSPILGVPAKYAEGHALRYNEYKEASEVKTKGSRVSVKAKSKMGDELIDIDI